MFKGNVMGVLPNGGMVSVVPKRVYTHIEFSDICEYVDWLNENNVEPETIVSCVVENHVYKVVYYYYKTSFINDGELESVRKIQQRLADECEREGASE